MSEKAINVRVINPRSQDYAERQAYAILRKLIKAVHTRLVQARIVLAWRDGWKPDADGHFKLAACRKASDVDYQLHGFDFVIEINREAWQAAEFSVEQQRALLDHELCHAEVRRDDLGEVVLDVDGRPAWRVREHDVEEFVEVVRRNGLWKADLENFAKVALDKIGVV